jgi:hypothetical protein
MVMELVIRGREARLGGSLFVGSVVVVIFLDGFFFLAGESIVFVVVLVLEMLPMVRFLTLGMLGVGVLDLVIFATLLVLFFTTDTSAFVSFLAGAIFFFAPASVQTEPTLN